MDVGRNTERQREDGWDSAAGAWTGRNKGGREPQADMTQLWHSLLKVCM